MTFLNAVMLAGVAGVVIPVVLHLLSRARFRTVEWGAMMFLQSGDARRRQASRLRQWILLLVRMGIIGVLALALARPVVNAGWGGDVPRAAVIVMDRSASMGLVESGRARIEPAREAALNVLAGLRKGDRAALLAAGGAREEVETVVPTTGELQQVARGVAAIDAGSGRAGWAAALERAADVLEATPGAGAGERREVYVVGDRQGGNWAGVDEGFARRWRGRFQGGAARAPVVYWVPAGGMDEANVAVDSVELLDAPAIRGQAAEVEVRLHNYGPALRAGLHVTMTAGDREVGRFEATLEPGQVLVQRVPVRFDAADPVVLAARVVDANDLAWDNVAFCAAQVTEPIRVLIVSGDERPGAFRSESDFLRLALTPFGGQGGRRKAEGGINATTAAASAPAADPRNAFDVTVAAAEKWADLELAKFGAVVLANVPALTPVQVLALEQYVHGGGGLVVAPGNLVRAEDYNRALYRNGTGLLPATLDDATSADGGATTLLGIDLTHPVFRFLGQTAVPVPSATVTRYFPATPRGPGARVLASLASGRPYLIAAPFSRGQVLLVTSPLDADWSSLPLSNFFLPFAQSMARYLATAGGESRNLKPGEPVVAAMEGEVDARSVVADRPDGRKDAAEVSRVGGRVEARYADTREPGLYTVRARGAGGERAIPFVVRRETAESDLRAATEERMGELRQMLGLQVPEEEGKRPETVAEAGGREMWGWLLAVVLALAVVEMRLARAWTEGPGKVAG